MKEYSTDAVEHVLTVQNEIGETAIGHTVLVDTLSPDWGSFQFKLMGYYSEPEFKGPDAWQNAAAEEVQAEAPVIQQWWRAFPPVPVW